MAEEKQPHLLWNKSLKSLKESVRFEVGDEAILDKAVYGVAKIFLKNQEKQERRWKEDIDHAIARAGKPVPKRYWEFPELEKGKKTFIFIRTLHFK